MQGSSHGHGHSDSVVKIKSLPFDANQLDIIQFFDGFKLKPNGVQLVVRSDNKPTGEASAGGGPSSANPIAHYRTQNRHLRVAWAMVQVQAMLASIEASALEASILASINNGLTHHTRLFAGVCGL